MNHASAWPQDWLQPDWPAGPAVRAVCSARSGGVSTGGYASFNAGSHVGDLPANVQENRRLLAGLSGVRHVFLDQVHGQRVLDLDEAHDGVQAEGAMSASHGLACTVLVADCLPVLLSDRAGTVVAALHAGWRGLLGENGAGVLEAGVRAMRAKLLARQAHADHLLAWMGPCIGPQKFEVGAEVQQAFTRGDTGAARHFVPLPGGKWLCDLAGLARMRLLACGVAQVYGNNASAAWCTASQPSRFFSYRRDRICGRMAVSVWLQG